MEALPKDFGLFPFPFFDVCPLLAMAVFIFRVVCRSRPHPGKTPVKHASQIDIV